MAASKKLAENNNRVRKEKKTKGGLKQPDGLQPEPVPEPSASFSLTEILSVANVVISLVGLYYKRKE